MQNLFFSFGHRFCNDPHPWKAVADVVRSFLTQTAAELEHGLIVLWEMYEFQAPLLEGYETDIFAALLRVRYSGHATVSSYAIVRQL